MSCLCQELEENELQEADSKQTAGTCLQVPAAGLNMLGIQPDDRRRNSQEVTWPSAIMASNSMDFFLEAGDSSPRLKAATETAPAESVRTWWSYTRGECGETAATSLSAS